MLPEEAYYRALARRLGCEYYRGEPPFAENFDPVKSLKCGVAPVTSAASRFARSLRPARAPFAASSR